MASHATVSHGSSVLQVASCDHREARQAAHVKPDGGAPQPIDVIVPFRDHHNGGVRQSSIDYTYIAAFKVTAEGTQ